MNANEGAWAPALVGATIVVAAITVPGFGDTERFIYVGFGAVFIGLAALLLWNGRRSR
jgi:hypothetical protein